MYHNFASRNLYDSGIIGLMQTYKYILARNRRQIGKGTTENIGAYLCSTPTAAHCNGRNLL